MIKARGFISWKNEDRSVHANKKTLRQWLLNRFPFEVVTENFAAEHQEVGEFVEGKWSVYFVWNISSDETHYFFELASDAMAFKLRWS